MVIDHDDQQDVMVRFFEILALTYGLGPKCSRTMWFNLVVLDH